MPEGTAYDEQRVRDGIAAWNRGDWETAIGMISPDVEWRLAQPLFDMPQVSHGHEGVIAFWAKWAEIWEHIHVEVEDVVPYDDGIAAFVRWRARGRDGVEVDQAVMFAFEINDGLTTGFTAYWDPDQGVEALGLSGPVGD
jgi:ketosteroid isomerase-like protein